MTKARESKKDKEGAELEAEKLRIQGMRQTAQEEYEEIKRLIADDDEYRRNADNVRKTGGIGGGIIIGITGSGDDYHTLTIGIFLLIRLLNFGGIL